MASVDRATWLVPPIKICACGAEHDARDWRELPLVGVMSDGGAPLELRNCSCHSTLAVALCSVADCSHRAVTARDDERDLCARHER